MFFRVIVVFPLRHRLSNLCSLYKTSEHATCGLFVCLCKMKILICVTLWGIFRSSYGVSTKLDFGEDSESVTHSSTSEDDNVEVKHTIVVSTKLKNNNRRGLHGSNDGESSFMSYNQKSIRHDSGEVPIIAGYKAVETTQILTPDTRHKPQVPTLIINRNIRDDDDIYPNIATNPSQWKPMTNFNNVNWWREDDSNIIRRIDRPAFQSPGKIHRTISDDGIKEFYCKKCRELSGVKCPQARSTNLWIQSTTPKIKLDGKLAKLN